MKNMRRRVFITVTAGVGLAGVAGCSDASTDPGNPGDVVQEFHETAAANSGDPETFEDEAAELVHSESPLRRQGVLERFFVRIENGERTAAEYDIVDVSTDVVDEDLSRDEITSRDELLEEADLDGGTLESVAEENASVETVVELGDGSTRNRTWLVTAVTARKPTRFSGGSKRVSSTEQSTDYTIADSQHHKNMNKE